MLLKNSILISHRMVSVQSSRENVISKVELWRNGPFSGELLMFSPQVTSVYPFPWELSPQVTPEHSFPLELSSRSHILDPQQHLITQNTMFFTNNRLLSKEAEHLSSELHTFCSHEDSQSKAPILLCKSVSSYRKEVKLTFELQANGAKHRGLILYRKIRCFLKKT